MRPIVGREAGLTPVDFGLPASARVHDHEGKASNELLILRDHAPAVRPMAGLVGFSSLLP
jgi:hypothetical protein